MTDTPERDPTRTEDVEEALEWVHAHLMAHFREKVPVSEARDMADRRLRPIRNLRERLEVQDEKLSELCDCGDHVATAMFCPVHDTENWRNVEEDYSRLARELHAARRRVDRLEEVEGEREQWRENWRVAQGDAAHASRRADRLERVVQVAREYVDAVQRSNLTGHEFPEIVSERFSDLVHSVEALDSREDEGGEPEHAGTVDDWSALCACGHDRGQHEHGHYACISDGCNCRAFADSEFGLTGDDLTDAANCVARLAGDEIPLEEGLALADRLLSVHADAPEGDEPYICENCGERIGHHTPGSDVEACSTFQPPPPTDEPKGEGVLQDADSQREVSANRNADEPEGDERTTKRKEICECGHPKWMHSIGGRTGPRGRCAENVCVCTEYRRDPSPTDEPEGDDGMFTCPECGERTTRDRDGLCVMCGADLTDEPVSREGDADYSYETDMTRLLCEEVNVTALGGECPYHGGDACLVVYYHAGHEYVRPTHADARSEVPEPDADDVRQMSDEELVEALESLAINFCQEAGFGYMPVKVHALEIKRRLSAGEEDCPLCGHPRRKHDPEDGLCDAGAGLDGHCPCGRNIAWMRSQMATHSSGRLSDRHEDEGEG